MADPIAGLWLNWRERHAFLQRTRQALWLQEFTRHGNCLCFVCGQPVGRRTCTLEHKIPLSRGGTDHPSNFAISHRQCNQDRGNTLDERIEPVPEAENDTPILHKVEYGWIVREMTNGRPYYHGRDRGAVDAEMVMPWLTKRPAIRYRKEHPGVEVLPVILTRTMKIYEGVGDSHPEDLVLGQPV